MQLQNITRTAAVIDYEQPGFADKFHPPKAYNPANLQTTTDAFLLQLAVAATDDDASKTAKAALAAQFVAHEMSPTFVADLQAGRKAVTDEQKAMESDSEDHIGNTAVINPLIRQGRQAKHTLDAIMHNRYGGQPAKLAAWISASHVERDPQHNPPPPSPVPAPPTTPPSK